MIGSLFYSKSILSLTTSVAIFFKLGQKSYFCSLKCLVFVPFPRSASFAFLTHGEAWGLPENASGECKLGLPGVICLKVYSMKADPG